MSWLMAIVTWVKSHIIISIIIGIVVVGGGITGVLYGVGNVGKEKIVYNKKYVSSSGDLWIEFNKDGTCNRSIETNYCNYSIENDTIIIEEEQYASTYGITMKLGLYYRIQDKNNIEHYHTCFPEYKDAHSDFKCNSVTSEGNLEKLGQTVKYSLDNKYVGQKKQDEEKNSSESKPKEKEEYQYGYHTLYTDKNGRSASIRFAENGVCETYFSSFNDSTNPSGVMRYTTKYVNNSCTYEKIQDRKLRIYDNTIIIRTATSGGKSMNMGNSRVTTKPIEIEFDDNYEKLKVTNGSFLYSGDPAFLTFEEDKNISKNNEENTSNNVTNETGNTSNNINGNKDNNINSTNNNTNNSTKYEYRYREKKQVVSYGSWSNWQEQKIEKNDSIEVETRKVDKQQTKTIYVYYHYVCPTPTQLAPQGNATPYSTDCAGEYYETIESDYAYKKKDGSGSCNYYYGGYYDYKKYNGPYKKENCWFDSDPREEKGDTVSVTEYRYREKYITYEWGNWSNWSTKKIESNENRQVEERTT